MAALIVNHEHDKSAHGTQETWRQLTSFDFTLSRVGAGGALCIPHCLQVARRSRQVPQAAHPCLAQARLGPASALSEVPVCATLQGLGAALLLGPAPSAAHAPDGRRGFHGGGSLPGSPTNAPPCSSRLRRKDAVPRRCQQVVQEGRDLRRGPLSFFRLFLQDPLRQRSPSRALRGSRMARLLHRT